MLLGCRLNPNVTWATPLRARVGAELLTYPATPTWRSRRPTTWDALGNLDHSDCVEAAELHQLKLRRRLAWEDDWEPSWEADALPLYRRQAGYDGTAATDLGTDDTVAARGWATAGIPTPGVVDVPWLGLFHPGDVNARCFATWALGGCSLILNLPLVAQAQVRAGRPLDVVKGPADQVAAGTWGLHQVAQVDYHENGDAVTVSWGQELVMTDAFLQTYGVRGWTTLSQLWLTSDLAKGEFAGDLYTALGDITREALA